MNKKKVVGLSFVAGLAIGAAAAIVKAGLLDKEHREAYKETATDICGKVKEFVHDKTAPLLQKRNLEVVGEQTPGITIPVESVPPEEVIPEQLEVLDE